MLEGAKLAFGQPVETRYDFSKADVIVSLDADFLYAGFPGNARYIRDFAQRRNPDGEMNRLYVVESTMTSTGAKADHRLPRLLPPSRRSRGQLGGGQYPEGRGSLLPASMMKDLESHHGSSLVLVGDHQPPVVHALAHALNQQFGNIGENGFLHRSGRRQSGQSD